MGVIIRTAGQNKPERFFDRDLNLLKKQWDEIEAKIKSQDSPAFLYEEPDLIGLTARDFLTDDVDRVQVDKKEDYDRLLETIDLISPKSKSKKFLTSTRKYQFLNDLMSRDKSSKLLCAGFFCLQVEKSLWRRPKHWYRLM